MSEPIEPASLPQDAEGSGQSQSRAPAAASNKQDPDWGQRQGSQGGDQPAAGADRDHAAEEAPGQSGTWRRSRGAGGRSRSVEGFDLDALIDRIRRLFKR